MLKRKNTRTADILLTSLVAAAALALTWAGLRGTKSAAIYTDAGLVGTELPDSAVVIVIDAGHGGFDGGATGANTCVSEAELNLDVAQKLKSELTARGFYVIMTRETPSALAESKSEDMRIRSRIMNIAEADLVISIHMNKFTDSTVSGPMVFYMKNSDEGKTLAECVMSGICAETGRPKRHVNPEDLFVLREPKCPSVLVECGFLSNRQDEALLTESGYRTQLAKGIANGVADYAATMLHDAP